MATNRSEGVTHSTILRGNLPGASVIGRLFRRAQWEVGQRLSVRAKLTIWYALMCALTLTLVGLGMRQALQVSTNNSIDPNLQKSAQRVVGALESPQLLAGPPSVFKNIFGIPITGSCSGPTSVYCNEVNTRLSAYLRSVYGGYGDVQNCDLAIREYCTQVKQALFDSSGTYDSPGVTEQVQIIQQGSGRPYPILTPGKRNPVRLTDPTDPLQLIRLLDLVRTSHHGQFIDVHDRGQVFRAYVQYVVPPKEVRNAIEGAPVGAVLEVLQNLHTYRQVQTSVNLILLVGLPLGLIVALIAGWWIARAALRPIDRISRTVRSVGDSRDLSRRVNFMGPEDEVGRLAATFDRMLARLEASFNNQKRFIADASHELRTPLTAIRGNADLMTIAPPSERDLCLSAIRREAERMSRLVSDLLLLAEADAEQQDVHKQPIKTSPIVQDVYRSALLLAGDRIDVILEHNDTVTLMADGDRVKQLLLNLADNAVKFTPEGGAVSIAATEVPEGIRFDISDSGIGIPVEEQESIFERFYRVEASRTKRGSGLGLAICAWIVHAHGGTISVRSMPDKGSTFTVTLPGKLSPIPEPAVPVPEPPSVGSAL